MNQIDQYVAQSFTGYLLLDVLTRLPSLQRRSTRCFHLFTPTSLTEVSVVLSLILGLVTRQPLLNSRMAIQVCRTSGRDFHISRRLTLLKSYLIAAIPVNFTTCSALLARIRFPSVTGTTLCYLKSASMFGAHLRGPSILHPQTLSLPLVDTQTRRWPYTKLDNGPRSHLRQRLHCESWTSRFRIHHGWIRHNARSWDILQHYLDRWKNEIV